MSDPRLLPRTATKVSADECPSRWEGGSHKWEPGAPGSPDWFWFCETERLSEDESFEGATP